MIFRHGGSLGKFIGDAIMAVGEAPLNGAQHAMATALKTAEALRHFKQELNDSSAHTRNQRHGKPRR